MVYSVVLLLYVVGTLTRISRGGSSILHRRSTPVASIILLDTAMHKLLHSCLIKCSGSFMWRRFCSSSLKDTLHQEMIKETLWAKSEKYQSFLKTVSQVPERHIIQPSLEGYMRERGCGEFTQDDAAMRIISTLTTHPLTLAYGIQHIFPSPLPRVRILALGMRSESTLPMMWWRETLLATEKSSQVELEMLGPDLSELNHSKSIDLPSGDENTTKMLMVHSPTENKVVFHEHPDHMDKLRSSDMFVLFNPGFGANAIMKKQWRDTLSLILQTRKPILCTAHSEGDLARDLAFLDFLTSEEDHENFGEPLEFLMMPHTNPFRSHRRRFDSNEDGNSNIVSANHSIYAFIRK